MKAPKKVITAMAIATLLGSGAGQAFADDFTNSGGVINGDPVKTTDQYRATLGPDESLSANGQITVNGTFTKNINTLPETTKDGHYLRVTMPIALDYSYNVDNNEMYSAPGKVMNQSVEVKGTTADKKGTEKPQAVNMTFVGMNDIDEQNIEYVSVTNENQQDTVELPFQLVVTKNGKEAASIHLADLVEAEKSGQPLESLKLEAGTSVDFKIDRISGQNVNNGDKLENNKKISNSITLKFEYLGNK